MRELIPVGEARDIVLAHARPASTEVVDIGKAVGRVLQEPIVARENIPPFDDSAMDGYAVLAGDLESVPVELEVIEDIPAGVVPTRSVVAGTCSRIMTGAPLPRGADAVVPVEWTDGYKEVGGRVKISTGPQPGQHVRRAGEDVPNGQTLFHSGLRVRSTMVGSFAALGYPRVKVSRRPTISILATGNELVEVGEPIGPGRIRNSNGPALESLAQSAGAEVLHSLSARDDFGEIVTKLRAGADADILLVSGGVSVGSHDLVKDALDELGTEFLFWRVKQRPGKPLAFGLLDQTLVFGLPGNPVSSVICFFEYVWPAVSLSMGLSATTPNLRPARLSSTVKKAPGLYHFIPGRSWTDDSGQFCVESAGGQGSHVSSSIARADCLIHLPEEMDAPPPLGAMVGTELLPCFTC